MDATFVLAKDGEDRPDWRPGRPCVVPVNMSDVIYIRRSSPRRRRTSLWGIGIVLLAVAVAFSIWRVRHHTSSRVSSVDLSLVDATNVPSPMAAANTTSSVSVLAPPAMETAPADSRGEADITADSIQAVRALLQARQFAAARERAFQALEVARDPAVRRAAEDLLGKIHIAMVLSPAPMPEKIDYVVQAGDRLSAIARRLGCTVELLMKGNELKSEVIRPGERLRVLTGRFRVEVSKSANELVVWLNDRFFKRYRVGTGEYDKTPSGEFIITERIMQPTWWRPDGRPVPYGDKDNVLGTHWLSLNVPGYGIHGTWEPETIGRSSSAGCIRLLNADIEELYTLLPVGTPVVIRD